MFGQPRRLPDRAHWIRRLRRQRPETALEAPSLIRYNNPRLPLEPLGAPVDERLLTRGLGPPLLVELDQLVDHRVHPPARLDVVQARDYHVEITVEGLVEALDHLLVRCDLYSRATRHHEVSCYFRFVKTYVFFPKKIKKRWGGIPEKELTIEVRHIDFVKINHMYVLEPAECQIFEQLATKTAGTLK
jgi:hypothetical protein